MIIKTKNMISVLKYLYLHESEQNLLVRGRAALKNFLYPPLFFFIGLQNLRENLLTMRYLMLFS